MKISQKALEYILLLLIVAIAFSAYYFGYSKFKEKADAVKAQNKAIEARIQELNDKIALKPEYEAGITDSKKVIDDVLKKYGPGNTPEKTIMFITDLQEQAGMSVSSVSFNPDNMIYASTDTDEDGVSKIFAYDTEVAVNYNTSYEGLKACMDYINAYPERMNVRSFTSMYNQETGGLNGSMILKLFSVADENHVYKEPAFSEIPLGLDNIFGTISADLINANGGIAVIGGETAENTEGAEATE